MKFAQVIFVLFLAISVVIGKRIKYDGVNSGITNGRVIGGRDAKLGETPYQVSLQTVWGEEYYHFCGGAIVAENFIVTAAHCVAGMDPRSVRVITGTVNWKIPGAIYFVKSIHVHCNYDNPLYNNDIAVLALNSSIAFDKTTKSIEINTEELKEGDDVFLSGWGSTVLGGDTPDNLQIVNLNYFPHDRCVSEHNSTTDVGIGHMCTFTKVGEGACHGDSGGPYVHENKLVGIVNWGKPCAVGKPDVNADPRFYHDFITSSMKGCNKW